MRGGIAVTDDLFEKKSYTCRNEVKSISIREITGEIVVQRDNVDYVTVSYYDRDDDPDYEIKESDGELSIIRKKRIHLFNFDIFRHTMTVTIPGDLEGELNITNKSGSIQISRISAKKVAIDNVTGNIRLEDVVSKDDLTVNNTSGSVTLENVKADEDVDVSNTTGRIEVDRLKCEGNISLRNVTGSVSGTIDGKKSDYSVSTKIVTGSSSLENSSLGKKKLKVSTTTGSIKLSFTE